MRFYCRSNRTQGQENGGELSLRKGTAAEKMEALEVAGVAALNHQQISVQLMKIMK